MFATVAFMKEAGKITYSSAKTINGCNTYRVPVAYSR